MNKKLLAIDLNGNVIKDIYKIEFFVDGQTVVNDEVPVSNLYFDKLVEVKS